MSQWGTPERVSSAALGGGAIEAVRDDLEQPAALLMSSAALGGSVEAALS